VTGHNQKTVGKGVRASSRNGPLRVGIGGPVGAGKTSMTDAL